MTVTERTISILVNNQPGVLSRIAGVFSRLGYNIQSLAVAETTNPAISRITLTSVAETDFTEKIKKQLDKLIDIITVTDFTDIPTVRRELMLMGVTFTAENRAELLRTVEMLRCRIITLSRDYAILEATGDPEKTAAILRTLEPFGVREMNRTGTIAVRRRGPAVDAEETAIH